RARTRRARRRASGRCVPWLRGGDVTSGALVRARLEERRRILVTALDCERTAGDEPAGDGFRGDDVVGRPTLDALQVEAVGGVRDRREEETRVRVKRVLQHL